MTNNQVTRELIAADCTGEGIDAILRISSEALAFVTDERHWPSFWQFLKNAHANGNYVRRPGCAVCANKEAELLSTLRGTVEMLTQFSP